MRLLAASYLVLALASAGCLLSSGMPGTVATHESIRETISQETVFCLPVGRRGGVGTPLCDAYNQPVQLDGQPVYFTGDLAEIVKCARDCHAGAGADRYLVRARDHVEKCLSINHPWHEEDYYRLVIEEILDVQAHCET